MEKTKIVFPKGFLWGSAISAHQTEGNNTNSDWWQWENSEARVKSLEAEGKNPEDFKSGLACDFYNRFEEDVKILKKLNQKAFRLSVEWARIEPEEGKFDSEVVEHYKKVLEALKKSEIKTFVTLHHYTLPLWFAEIGGFEKKANVEFFVRYAKFITSQFTNLVDFWITINEPEIYTSHAFLVGRYPPQKKSWISTLSVIHNLIAAHNSAYKVIKEVSSKPISMAYHRIDLLPRSIFSKILRGVVHYVTNEYFLRRTAKYVDFIGINYYGHSHIGFLGRYMHGKHQHETNDLGWGIHPEGLERVLLGLRRYKKPIYITENGLADASDAKRLNFIRNHLYFAHRAIERGVDLKGYLHWSLMDNFEWAHGNSPRFGLVAIDYKNQKRTIRPSAHEYAKICRDNSFEYL